MLIGITIGLFFVFLTLTYIYYKYVIFDFWRKKGVFYIKPVVPIGNMTDLISGKIQIEYIAIKKIDPLTGHLFLMPGKKWRNLRVKLTPTFTSGKQMFLVLKECGEELANTLTNKTYTGDAIDIKDIFAK